ncbi:unnamed protein product [Haemonchus placei]|uniref:MADF domain-containing protein n=1 Tax=Haemonchus placei TaxID=6290 RepID=A0A158QLN2_HAEPC|nr:unnamed protein product [Haemonchus placei]
MNCRYSDSSCGEEWDARSKVALIQCYRDEPGIWNVHVTYRTDTDRRQSLNDAWRRIEQRMNCMGYNFELPQLKKKMKQLKDQFVRENKMFEDHSSKWQFYEEMRFLNQDEEPSPEFNTLNLGLLNYVGPVIAQSPSPTQEESLLFNDVENHIRNCSSSLDIEVKSEFKLNEDLSLFNDHDKPRASITPSGVVLPESLMDELLRLVLSNKNVILNEDSDEESKNRAWLEIHLSLKAINQTIPSVDELKEVFSRKYLLINDIVLNHYKEDNYSTNVRRFLQSAVSKCLPEDKFTARERELGAIALRKLFPPQENKPPSTRKRRFADIANGEEDQHSRAGASVDKQTETERIFQPTNTDAPKNGTCGCHSDDGCFRESLSEMIKAQKEYFKIAAEVQKEQLRLFSAMGDVLNRVSSKLLPPDPCHI